MKQSKGSGTNKVLILFLIWFYSGGLIGQKTWTGNGNGNTWHDASNWNPIGVPTASDEVLINLNDVITIDPPIPTDTVYAKSITLDGVAKFSVVAGAVLKIDGNSNATNTINITQSVFSNGGKIIVMGAISDGIKIYSGGVFSNYGNISVKNFANNANGQGVEIEPGASFGNFSVFTIIGGGAHTEDGIVNDGFLSNDYQLFIRNIKGNSQSFGLENYSIVDNDGYIEIDSVETASGVFNSGNQASYKNNGSTYLYNIFNPTVSGFEVLNGAKLFGEGTIGCNEVVIGANNSIISPGDGVGVLTISGDLFMDVDSRLDLEIRGDNGPGSNSGHDQLVITGNLVLDQDVANKPGGKVILLGGFFPELHRNYAFINFYGTRTGFFDFSVDKPPGLIGWSYRPKDQHHYVFARYCGGSEIIENCSGPSCELWTGNYSAEDLIQYSGPFIILDGEEVEFKSTNVELSAGFEVELGATFEIVSDVCDT